MAETGFELRLERMFAEAPTLADAELFAARVLRRLERDWFARRLLIGAMGVLGGLIGAFEVLRTGALGLLGVFAGRWVEILAAPGPVSAGASIDLHVLGTLAAVVLVAACVALARLIREI